MIAGGQPRGRHVQSEFLQAVVGRFEHGRMTGQPEVIAAGKISELAVALADAAAIRLLERFRLGHQGICNTEVYRTARTNFWRRGCGTPSSGSDAKSGAWEGIPGFWNFG